MNIINQIFEKYKSCDRVILSIIIVLTMVSLLFIYSTSANLGNTFHHLKKQFIFFFIGYIFITFLFFINYRVFFVFANILIFTSIGLLVLTQLEGESINGAKRWLKLPGTDVTFQPSELAKIAVVCYTAKILAMHQTIRGFNFKIFWKFMWPVAIILVLVIKDDFSTTILIGLTIFIMLFVGRTPLKTIGHFFLIGLITLLTLVIVSKTTYRPKIWRVPTILNRFDEHTQFVNKTFKLRLKEKNKDKNLQANQAKAAIAAGGIIGKGFGKSDKRYLLPLPYSDFIYAIIIEERGLIGGMLLLFLYLTLVFRAGIIVNKCNKTFPAFLVVGLTVSIVFQALFHMSISVSLLPVTGQPLPFVSMGGTSQIFTAIAFGIILSISYSTNKMRKLKKLETENQLKLLEKKTRTGLLNVLKIN